ncbi:MAG: glutathione peroxidase [Pleomorphochaeta sp.]
MNLYDYKVKDMEHEEVSLSEYKGKVVLVINTATECGFTPQYASLEKIYKEFKEKGLEILDFPCNQFGEQAPGSEKDIHKFCTGRFGITFPQFAKIEVNGDDAIDLYKDLVANTKFEGFDKEHEITPILEDLLPKFDVDWNKKSTIKWNFTKFLFDRDGSLIKRYEPTYSVVKLEEEISKLL